MSKEQTFVEQGHDTSKRQNFVDQGHDTSKLLLALVSLFIVLANIPLCVAARAEESHKIRFSAPAIPQAIPFLHMAQSEMFRSSGKIAEFVPWRSQEQVQTLIATGAVDAVIVALPTAAVLYNKGVPCTVLAVYSAPLWLVSNAPLVPGNPDERPGDMFVHLQGQEILLPFGPGNMPVLVFNILAAEKELDCKMRHCGSALEAASLLRLDQPAHALLAEPAATLATIQEKSASGIYKKFMLNAVWEEVFSEQYPMVTAALVMVGPLSENQDICFTVQQHFMAGAEWTMKNSTEALQLVKKYHPELDNILVSLPDGGQESCRFLGLQTGMRGKQATMFMLERLFDMNPKSLGGKLPDESFWGCYGTMP